MRKRYAFAVAGTALLTSWSALQAVTVQWVPDADGDWSVASNWSSDPGLPGAGDDVVIDIGGVEVRTVTLDVNASIKSLVSMESLTFSGARTLTLAEGGSFGPEAAFTMDTNARLNINGGTFVLNGPANIDGANIFLTNASADLSSITQYITDTGTNNNRTLQVSGSGAVLDLGGTNTIQGGGFIRTLFVNALSGATIDLANLETHDIGATRFRADGAGSAIDLGMLESFHNSNNDRTGALVVSDGGTVLVPSLTAVSANRDNRMEIIADGATSTLDTSGIQTMTNTLVQLLNGGSADLTGVTSFGGSSLDIRDGAVVQMPNLTDYSPNAGGNGNRTWRVRDGARIEAANLLTAEGGTFIGVRNWTIDAQSGGVIDLSSLQEITDGDTRVRADGPGSLVDLSSLVNWRRAGSTLTATNGGEVRLPSAADMSIVFQGVAITDNGSGTLDLSRLTSSVSGSLTATGVIMETPSLTNITDSNLTAIDGARISLPALEVTEYLHGGGNVERRFSSRGEDSVLDLSSMTAITINAGTIPSMRIDAAEGGVIDLSGVETINATPGIINGSRAIRVIADGENSLVDLSALTEFKDLASVTNSSITAQNGGVVRLHPTEITQLTNLTITIGAGSRLEGAGIELLGVFTNTSGQSPADRIDDSRLMGAGVVTGDVINTSGFVLTGSETGELMIEGNFQQNDTGLVEIKLGGTEPGISHDRLIASGSMQLGGLLQVTLVEGFELEFEQRFEIVSAGGVLTGTFFDLPDQSVVGTFGGIDLFIEYRPDAGRVDLYTIPEPASLVLLGLGAWVLVGQRRR